MKKASSNNLAHWIRDTAPDACGGRMTSYFEQDTADRNCAMSERFSKAMKEFGKYVTRRILYRSWLIPRLFRSFLTTHEGQIFDA